jgi:hypothetical protein
MHLCHCLIMLLLVSLLDLIHLLPYFDTFVSLCDCWITEIFCNCAYFGGSLAGEAAKTSIIYKKILKYVRR